MIKLISLSWRHTLTILQTALQASQPNKLPDWKYATRIGFCPTHFNSFQSMVHACRQCVILSQVGLYNKHYDVTKNFLVGKQKLAQIMQPFVQSLSCGLKGDSENFLYLVQNNVMSMNTLFHWHFITPTNLKFTRNRQLLALKCQRKFSQILSNKFVSLFHNQCLPFSLWRALAHLP